MKLPKLPAFQFYPADWRKDPGIQALSYEERGIWFEMICLMHESEERGKLTLNGKAINNKRLSKMLGLEPRKFSKIIVEFLELGVASKCEITGAIVSKRMVRDEVIRQIRSESGKKGGEKSPSKSEANGKQNAKQNDPPSSSTSVLKENNKENGEGESQQEAKPFLIKPNHLVAEWNSVFDFEGSEISKVSKVAGKRKTLVEARCREKLFVDNYGKALKKMASTPFFHGEGDSGWIAGVDWFVKPGTIANFIEGKYRNLPDNRKLKIDKLESEIDENSCNPKAPCYRPSHREDDERMRDYKAKVSTLALLKGGGR